MVLKTTSLSFELRVSLLYTMFIFLVHCLDSCHSFLTPLGLIVFIHLFLYFPIFIIFIFISVFLCILLAIFSFSLFLLTYMDSYMILSYNIYLLLLISLHSFLNHFTYNIYPDNLVFSLASRSFLFNALV